MISGVNVRQLALEALLAVTKDGQHSHIVLSQILEKHQYLSRQERSFLNRAVMGTLEHMLWIDYVLDRFSTVKVGKMKPVIRCILRSAVYELKHMDAVPSRATCSEAVKLARKKGFEHLTGFVNGVLRNVSRGIDEIPLPDREAEPACYLSVRYSMPEWIVEEWASCYGWEQAQEILEAFLAESPTCIGANTARITRQGLWERLLREGATVRENPQIEDGLLISDYDYLGALPSFREGLFYVQDASSMIAVRAACEGLAPGQEGSRSGSEGHGPGQETVRAACEGLAPAQGKIRVVDVCAAPGGKSISMAVRLGDAAIVEARDLTERKAQQIRENVARCGLSNIEVRVADARHTDPKDDQSVDVAIADLPCSGLGVVGRKPEVKYRMTKGQQEELARLQREILHATAACVKMGGTLLYSVCTISRIENEDNVRWFLREHPNFALEEERQLFPRAGLQDGFYYARLRKGKAGSDGEG